MDKIEPLIRHRFWILFVISLPLAVAGYFLTNSEMQAATETREGTLKSVLGGVPEGTSDPNKDFANGLAAINKELQQQNDVEIQKLWEDQRERMTWPEIMHRYLPDVHRGEIDLGGRRQYVKEYPGIVRRLWERVQPVVSDPHPIGLTVDWPEKVVLMPETLPVAQFTEHQQISSREMWNAQEDVWLMELLFDAIVRTNEGASNIMEAPVRAIEELYLTGGNGDPTAFITGDDGPKGGGGKGRDRDADEFGSWEEFDAAQGGEGSGGGRSSYDDDDDDGGSVYVSPSVRPPAEISFEIAEEIGPQVPDPEVKIATAGNSGSGNASLALSGISLGQSSQERMGGMAMRARAQARGAGAATARPTNAPPGSPNMFRYIGKPEDVKDQLYHERAFYISAVVMLPDLPNFLTELASSEWPIQIGRFHVGPNPYAEELSNLSGRSPNRNARRRPLVSRTRMNSDDDDDGGLFSGLSGNAAWGGVPGSGFGPRRGGNYVLPPTMAGPQEIDPNWFASPDLVQVDLYGVITIYKPVTNAAITKKSDGTSEAESLEDIEAAEAAVKAAEDAATETNETPDVEPANDSSGDETLPGGDVDESDTGDSTDQPPSETGDAAEEDSSFTFGNPDEPPPDETSESDAPPDQ